MNKADCIENERLAAVGLQRLVLQRVEMERLAQISKEVREQGGEPEAKLCAKCSWERMSRTAVIRNWGDPRTWA